jgi:hypothetical protein
MAGSGDGGVSGKRHHRPPRDLEAEMSDKTCPNCGIQVAMSAETCRCGFAFQERGIETPGPGAVRKRDMAERAPAARRGVLVAVSARQAGQPAARTVRRPRPAAVVEDAEPHPNDALLMDCPGCRARISRRAAECPKCGLEPFAYCQICAERIPVDVSPCPECGDPEPFPGPGA